MTKAEFIKWLGIMTTQCTYNKSLFNCMSEVLSKAQSLADTKAEEQSRPLADKGLVEELKKWCKDRNSCTEFSAGQDFAKDDVLYIISRYSPQESIAELADRKGYYISRQMNRFKDTKAEWIINLEPSAYEYSPKWFAEIAYTDCEAKARQYLEGLPDRKEGEK